MIRVVVVDDHEIVRKGLIAFLQTDPAIDVIGEAGSGQEGEKIVKNMQPDVVLMDLMMENGTGIEATKAIIAQYPQIRIIILTSYYDDEQVFPAIEAGAFSYILKTSSASEIATAIKKAANNENVIESKVAGKMMSGMRTAEKKPHDDLTARELEVLLCIGNGMTNQEISDKLYIGIKTVKTHVSHILAKLEVSDRTQAAVYVHHNQLLK